MANYIVLGTWNTKREDLDFLCDEIKRRSHRPIPLDLSTKKANVTRNIAVGQSISRARARLHEIAEKEHISGAISVGGGTNLFMATKLMEDIPLFVPKIIISTMIVNSIHNFKPHKDILYFQSPCDFGILNPLTKSILTNCVKMLTSTDGGLPSVDKPSIAITGFGITDGCFEAVKNFWLRKHFYLIPFHSIGENTMAMAELIQMGFFKGILDLTLHDVMDHIAGGAYGKIDQNRLYAYLSRDLPAVIAPGGLDTIAFPEGHPSLSSFKKRKRYHHDFRWGIKANKEEMIEAAKWIGNILRKTHPQKSVFLIPLRGWSYPGEPGKEFYDPELIGLFVKWIKKFYKENSVVEVDLSINDPEFGRIASEHLYAL
ncbi:MAG TPA: Tm-1-like ATP-binding domain-containing protein, partial [Thermodesulfobacteriota bacterium]|nr:Tm-1-like ATP-binding domain-containing protein [Thermodesulfobacteriota bacterium]